MQWPAVGVGPSQVALSGTPVPTKLSTAQTCISFTTVRGRSSCLSHHLTPFYTQDKMPPKAAQPREFVHPEASHARKV